jgi:hypothetical protein
MIDCPNVEMRDRLPDLANDSLEPSVRVLVLAHLEQCAHCTAEIEILRTTRLILLTTTPKVNVAAIALALPSYDSPPREGRGVTPLASARRRSFSNSWAVAAAVAVFAAGIGSYAVLRPGAPIGPIDSAVLAAAPGMALTGALADLSDDELDALTQDIAAIEALPSTEVVYMANAVNVPLILPDSMVPEMEDR